jgi:NAD(P)-dependent dehydrogenase (short-subunit alcohol dehydrogenase family)
LLGAEKVVEIEGGRLFFPDERSDEFVDAFRPFWWNVRQCSPRLHSPGDGGEAEMFELSDRVAVVTGAGQGVGAGIARLLAGQGAVVAVNDLDVTRAETTVAAVEAAGGRAAAFVFDVTDFGGVAAAVEDIKSALGPIDILVNNAGNGGAEGMKPAQFRDSDPKSWHGPIDVNLFGVLNCSRNVIGDMCDRGWGRVITIASGAGVVGLRIGVSAYGAGKGGAIGFMRHLAVESARFGVTANTLALGLMTNPGGPGIAEGLARQIPVGRTGTPEDIGALCVYLASNEATWMTGQTIHINGGAVTS